MELLIITGLSGAGKTRAADVCEDLSYYCVDNLPAALLPQFAAMCAAARSRFERAALVMDVRAISDRSELLEVLSALDALGETVRILYLEADEGAILRRYKESRRPHPLASTVGDIRRAIRAETTLLEPLRDRADLVIDTTGMSLNTLGLKIRALLEPEVPHAFRVNVVSFGYKNGIPPESDLVFDVRCLPNPFYIDSLRDRTGLDPEVRDYIFRDSAAEELLGRLSSLCLFLVPLYGNDRAELTIAVGCTGGHHRSVAIAQALADRLAPTEADVSVRHRDLER